MVGDRAIGQHGFGVAQHHEQPVAENRLAERAVDRREAQIRKSVAGRAGVADRQPRPRHLVAGIADGETRRRYGGDGARRQRHRCAAKRRRHPLRVGKPCNLAPALGRDAARFDLAREIGLRGLQAGIADHRKSWRVLLGRQRRGGNLEIVEEAGFTAGIEGSVLRLGVVAQGAAAADPAPSGGAERGECGWSGVRARQIARIRCGIRIRRSVGRVAGAKAQHHTASGR